MFFVVLLLQSDSANELDSLEGVKNHYGSLEIDSITQATAINDTGIYYVGKIKDRSCSLMVC